MYEQAQTLASKGRYGDSMLVHMSPREVGGLQALARTHGTSMTINPQTGLPEAFKLSDILPTIAGVGLSFMGVPPWLAGVGVGGFETARTGNLGRGIMAGLGAFGGAGLGSALSSAGATAAGTTAADLGVAGASSAPGSQAAMLSAQNAGFEEAGREALRSAASTAGPNFINTGMTAPMGNAQLAFEGAKSLGTKEGWSNLATGLDKAFPTMTEKFLSATPTALSVANALQPQYQLPSIPKEPSTYAGPYVPTQRGLRYPGYRGEDTSEFQYFTPSNPVPGYTTYAASGGLMDAGLAAGGSFDDERGSDDRYAEGGQTQDRSIRMPDANYQGGVDPEFSHNFLPVEIQGKTIPMASAPASVGGKGALKQLLTRLSNEGKFQNYTDLSGYQFNPQTQRLEKMAAGGLAAFKQGTFLQGAGDGMSDSIPATIGDRQPARLADGEFVVPADVVSHIGNGSSKAGAEKLYGMMDKVRKQRTGKTRQAPAIRAEKYMPA